MHVIIGSTKEALSRCMGLDATLIYNNVVCPFPFEESHDDWCEKVLSLNLSGKGIYFNKVKNIRVTEQEIDVLLKNNKRATINYDLCEIFDCANLDLGGFEICNYKERYLVYDFFEIKSLDKNELENVKSKDSIFNEIWFLNNNTLVSKSILTGQQLHQIEFSDTYLRFHLISKLESMGMKGSKNGKNKNGEQIYLKPDIESIKREVIVQKSEVYQNTGKVIFHDTGW
jgi:hypothetical protein